MVEQNSPKKTKCVYISFQNRSLFGLYQHCTANKVVVRTISAVQTWKSNKDKRWFERQNLKSLALMIKYTSSEDVFVVVHSYHEAKLLSCEDAVKSLNLFLA